MPAEASPAAPALTIANPKSRVKQRLITLNDLLWLIYLYPLRWLARVVPRRFLYALGNLADPIVQFHARERKAKAAPWIGEACGAAPDRARKIAELSLSNNLFRTLDDLLLLRPASELELRCEGLDGIEHLQNAIARGKGVILLVGHFCANRIAVRYLAQRGWAALAVHNRRPTNMAEGWFGRRWLQPRAIQLQKLAYPDQASIQDRDCSLKVMQRLRAGGLAVLQMDGRAGTNPIEQKFLGVSWDVPSGIFEIARLSECAVVPMLCLGCGDGFRIRFDPALEIVRESSREAFACANLPRFLRVVERQIIEHPEEWRLWNHFRAQLP